VNVDRLEVALCGRLSGKEVCTVTTRNEDSFRLDLTVSPYFWLVVQKAIPSMDPGVVVNVHPFHESRDRIRSQLEGLAGSVGGFPMRWRELNLSQPMFHVHVRIPRKKENTRTLLEIVNALANSLTPA
jgi:hypothetical protein